MNYHIGQTIDHWGCLGKITAITANARTGEQESIIVRFVWSDEAYEFKVDDKGLSTPEIYPHWMSRENDVINISDKD